MLKPLRRSSLTLTVLAAHFSADCFVYLKQCNSDFNESRVCYQTNRAAQTTGPNSETAACKYAVIHFTFNNVIYSEVRKPQGK